MKQKKFLIIGIFFISMLILTIVSVNTVQGATTNTGSCLCNAWGNYKNEWTNPKNALTQNNIYATSVVGTAGNNEEDYYVFYTIPSMLAGYDLKTIDGITVSIDAYASSTGCYSTVQLSWNGGSSFTGTKTTANWGTSDTNTYLSVGGASDTWSRTWTKSEFATGNFDVYIYSYGNLATKTIYYDHVIVTVYFTYYPSPPTNFEGMVKECGENGISLSWVKGTGADYTRIQRRNDKFPTGISDGDNIYNSTGTSTTDSTDLVCGDIYYYASWGYSSADKLWSTSQSSAIVSWCGDCVECDLTVVNNTRHTTGKYETAQDEDGCYTIWLNYTGAIPDLEQFENIVNATGTHEYSWDAGHWKFSDWANYTGNTTPIKNMFENIINATGTHEYALSPIGYLIWANYTGNTTPIWKTHTNYIDATGTLEYQLTGLGYDIWANATGNWSMSYPFAPTTANVIIDTCWNSNDTQNLKLYWTKGLNSDSTMVRYSDTSYPTNIATGTLLYNGSSQNCFHNYVQPNIEYFYSFFSWSDTYGWNTTAKDTTKWYGCRYIPNFFYNMKNVSGPYPPFFYYDAFGFQIYLNYTGNTTPITQYENIVNATGTHEYVLTGSGYLDYANYTGDTTPITLNENIVDATGTHEYLLNETGYQVWANYTGTGGSCNSTNLTVHNNTAHTTGPYETSYDSSTGWDIWLNYTGAIPGLNKYENIVHATGSHDSNWDSTGWDYNVWANYTADTPTITQYQNIVNATGTHQYYWDSTLWKFLDWANYTGNTTPITQYENIINATGTHEYVLTGSGYLDYANYTGDTTPITLDENIINATGSHEYNLQNDGYHIWANYTGNATICPSTDLTFINNLINVTGTNASIYNTTTGWTIWLNFTGNTTAINFINNLINATGSHDYILNSTGYWIWVNYTGNTTPITQYENIVNATGTHEYVLTGSGYLDYANYTGLNGLNLFENIINATGTHQSLWDGSAWNVWANYTGNETICPPCPSTNLTFINNLINLTGTNDSSYDPTTGWTVWLNLTGNATSINFIEAIINATGSHDYILNSTGYWIWINYTGNTTPIHIINATYDLNGTGYWIVGNTTPITLLENIINATGTHEYLLDGSGYFVWANYTGNETICPSTDLTVYDNTAHTTGDYTTLYNSTTGWDVWLNITGDVPTFLKYQNINHASGTHQSSWDSTNWIYRVWANYTGDTPSITQYENIINATGTHQYIWNSASWRFYDWANYTGNTTPLNLIDNTINTTGSLDSLLNNTGWWVFANFSGNATPIHLFQNFVNCNGTHEYFVNETGYQVYANASGNLSTILPVGIYSNSIYLFGGGCLALPIGLLLYARQRRRKIYKDD